MALSDLMTVFPQEKGCEGHNLDVVVAAAPGTGIWFHQNGSNIRIDFDHVDGVIESLKKFKLLRNDK